MNINSGYRPKQTAIDSMRSCLRRICLSLCSEFVNSFARHITYMFYTMESLWTLECVVGLIVSHCCYTVTVTLINVDSNNPCSNFPQNVII